MGDPMQPVRAPDGAAKADEAAISARTATAHLMLDEALRRRELQEQFVSDLRRRSVAVLTIVSASTVIVAGLVEREPIQWGFAAAAAISVAAMVFATIQVQRPRGGFVSGVNLSDAHQIQFNEAHTAHQVVRDFAIYHYEDVVKNVRGPIRQMQRWFTAELTAAGVIVLVVVISATV